MKRAVLVRDEYQCQQCRRFCEMEDSHLDHVVPIAEGGGDEPENLQTLCLKCSKAKTAKEAAAGRQRG